MILLKMKQNMKQWVIPLILGILISIFNSLTYNKYDKLVNSVVLLIGSIIGFRITYILYKLRKDDTHVLSLTVSILLLGLSISGILRYYNIANYNLF